MLVEALAITFGQFRLQVVGRDHILSFYLFIYFLDLNLTVALESAQTLQTVSFLAPEMLNLVCQILIF